jgi:hypothetical protein
VLAPNVVQQFESQIPPIAGKILSRSSPSAPIPSLPIFLNIRISPPFPPFHSLQIVGFSLRLLSSQSHYAWLESHLPILQTSLFLSLFSLFLCIASYAFEPVAGVVLCYLIISMYPTFCALPPSLSSLPLWRYFLFRLPLSPSLPT